MIEWGNQALSISIWKGDWVLQIQGHLKEMSNKIILRQRTFHAINQLGETSPILFDFLPPSCKEIFREIYIFGGKWEPALLLAIKLCPISPWRNKLVWLGHIYLATELYIAAELEDILFEIWCHATMYFAHCLWWSLAIYK